MAARETVKKYVLFFLTVVITVIIDQLSKAIIQAKLNANDVISVIPDFMNLTLVKNRGAAFGFLNRDDIEWQFWLFIGATLVAFVVILQVLRDIRNRPLLTLALGLILGGAIGNVIDRIHSKAVVDFLDFYVGDWHWPAFNVADIAICVGAFLACLFYLWKKPRSG